MPGRRPPRTIWAIAARGIAAGLIALTALAPNTSASTRSPAVSGPNVVPAVDAKCVTYTCYTLTVVFDGNGYGRWTSTDSQYNPDGKIDCQWSLGSVVPGSICSHQYADILRQGYVDVWWKIAPETGSVVCLGGTCYPSAGRMQHLVGDSTQTATLTLVRVNVIATFAGDGAGQITITYADSAKTLTCETGGSITCAISTDYGYPVFLEAFPKVGSTFAGWTGACVDQPSFCGVDTRSLDDLLTSVIFSLGSPSPSPGKSSPKPSSAGRTPNPTPAGSIAAGASGGAESPSTSATGSPVAAAPSANPGDQSLIPAEPAAAGGAGVPLALAIVGGGALVGIAIGIAAARYRKKPGASGPPSA
jgi:hypothetical protein